MKKKLKIPDGYRRLQPTETISYGDKVWSDDYQKWFSAGAIGMKANATAIHDLIYIRLKEK